MGYFNIFICVVALLHSVIAFSNGHISYGFGLLGGFGAWVLVTVCQFKHGRV